ncbi:hypothetical protein V8G54_031515 [Vigna mungo]|uniref:Uncharacterized protein n=1 Tax=Vigna mungo TaxID=3915 RepID=A0AAQ3RGZ6_VIGMU
MQGRKSVLGEENLKEETHLPSTRPVRRTSLWPAGKVAGDNTYSGSTATHCGISPSTLGMQALTPRSMDDDIVARLFAAEGSRHDVATSNTGHHRSVALFLLPSSIPAKANPSFLLAVEIKEKYTERVENGVLEKTMVEVGLNQRSKTKVPVVETVILNLAEFLFVVDQKDFDLNILITVFGGVAEQMSWAVFVVSSHEAVIGPRAVKTGNSTRPGPAHHGLVT